MQIISTNLTFLMQYLWTQAMPKQPGSPHLTLCYSALEETTKSLPSTVSPTATIPHVNIASFPHFRGSYELLTKSKVVCTVPRENSEL